jgi:hypothetical protein
MPVVTEPYVNPDECRDFFAAIEQEKGEDELDVQDDLMNIAFLAMTGNPIGYDEPLKKAVAALRERLIDRNEKLKYLPWAHADDVAEWFEKSIAEVVGEPKDLIYVPIVEGNCEVEKIANFHVLACRAKAARARFEDEKPPGAPRLPTDLNSIRRMQKSPDAMSRLVGDFALSWREVGWRNTHPSFDDYCGGRNPGASYLVRRAGLPVDPRPLTGLDQQTLCWRPPGERPRIIRP